MMQQPYWALDSYFKKHNDILIQGEQQEKEGSRNPIRRSVHKETLGLKEDFTCFEVQI